MQIICAWCRKFIRKKEPLGNRAISHSICDGCATKVKDEITKFLKEQEDVGEEKKSECKKG